MGYDHKLKELLEDYLILLGAVELDVEIQHLRLQTASDNEEKRNG